MTLRGRTVVVGSTLTAVFLVAAAAIPIPYVAIGPGVTYDTLGSVEGSRGDQLQRGRHPGLGRPRTSPIRGHLNMTTISITDNVPLFEALGLWATGRYALAPREDYFPPDKTVEEVKEQDAQAFRDSQSAAEIAALRYLGYPNVTYVGEIPDGFAEYRGAASRRTRSSTSTAPRSPISRHCRPCSPTAHPVRWSR